MPSITRRTTIIIVLVVTLVVTAASAWAYRDWLGVSLPIAILGVLAALYIALDVTSKIRDLFFPDKPLAPPVTTPLLQEIHPEGDFVAGNKTMYGDEVRGDKIVNVLPPPLTPSSALHSLPDAPPDFTGRANEIEQLEHALIEESGVHISGLTGLGGVGKTALALLVANKVKDNFRDAQIYLDLKGTASKPRTSRGVMEEVIHAFKPGEDLRDYSEERTAACYLSLLAGKRVLLLLDNARDATQVRPLLAPAPCTVLITSRWTFVLPGMHPLPLGVLPPEEARDLLLRICQRIGNVAEPGMTDDLAKACAYLPLALRIAGSALAEDKTLAVRTYLTALGDRRKRLATLKGGEVELDLEAVLGYSYDRLSPDAQAWWRALAVFPAPFDISASAAVWGLEEARARSLLSSFVKANILDFDEPTGHFSLHDLLIDFAVERLSDGERFKSSLRHATHYEKVARAADELFEQGGDNVSAGLRLFDSEWAHVRAGQAWSAENAPANDDAARLANDYPDAAANCLSLRLLPRERIRWLETALAAARRLENKGAEDAHLGNLGIAYRALGEVPKAIECFEQALAIARAIGDKDGEGTWLGNLGIAYLNLGEVGKAIENYEQALAIARAIGDRQGEGAWLGNLGIAYRVLGEVAKATAYYEQALAIARAIGDRRGEGISLHNLGLAYVQLRRKDKARECFAQALGIFRAIEAKREEQAVLDALARLGTD